MKLKYLILSAVALLGFNAVYAQDSGASPFAEFGHMWGHHQKGAFFKELNLTDAQKQQLKQYFSDNKQALKNDLLKLLNAKKAENAALEKNPSDESTIRSLATNVESARTDLTIQRAKVHAYLLSILTTEQKQTLTNLEQKRDAHLQEKIDHLNQSNS